MPETRTPAPTAVNPSSGPGDSRPVPDPTVLTTQLIDRALGSLQRLHEARFDAMDKAIDLLQSTSTDKIPGQIRAEVGHLKEVHTEKFASVQKQFDERDVRTEQAAASTKIAVDAALSAAKEAASESNKSSTTAINKQEAATAKLMDQLAIQMDSRFKATDDKIADVKKWQDRNEGRLEGSDKSSATHQTANSNMVGLIGMIIGALIGITGIIFAIVRSR